MIDRRSFLRFAAVGGIASALSVPARAQSFPGKPVKIILGLAPGASTDIGTRMLAQGLTEVTGQPFIAVVVVSSPSQFADFFHREVALYKRVAEASNIRLES